MPPLSLPVLRHILCRDKSRVPADVRYFDAVIHVVVFIDEGGFMLMMDKVSIRSPGRLKNGF